MPINRPGANALDELPQLVRVIAKTQRSDNPNCINPECWEALYACSLVSELAYYHVPQFELDSKRRFGVIPCEGHRQLVSRGYSPTDVREYVQKQNLGENLTTFAIMSRGIIVVGVAIYDVIFVSFRGSHYAYDWRVNLNAGLLRDGAEAHYKFRYAIGVHAGFFEEEQRVHELVNHELLMLRERKPDELIHVFFTGHSLGGAIAAICGRQIGSSYSRSASSLLFGAPRYHGNAWPASQYELSIQRRGDIVPNAPPRVIGYVDHRRQLDTRGQEIVEPIGHKESSSFGFLTSLVRQNPIAAHDIEGYRGDLGRLTHSALWGSPLIDASKL